MTLQNRWLVLLAGAGNMGAALLAGWLERGLDRSASIVQDPSPPPATRGAARPHGIAGQRQLGALPEPPAVIVVAVKPQVMDEVFPPLAQLAGQEHGRAVDRGRTDHRRLRAASCANGTAVIRSMPNTPAAIGRGITRGRRQRARDAGAAPGLRRPAARRRRGGLGRRRGPARCRHRRLGLGPAYVFYLAECLARPASRPGWRPSWPEAGALDGVGRRRTVAPFRPRRRYAAPERDLARRHHFAALQVLMAETGLPKLMREAVAAATQRSRELAK